MMGIPIREPAPEGVQKHDDAKRKYRIHRAVFEIDVFFDGIDVADGEAAAAQSAPKPLPMMIRGLRA